MDSKNYTQVLIDGKIYMLGGSEDEAYLQKAASYVNEKNAVMRKVPGFSKQSAEYQMVMTELNIADDYFKALERAGGMERQKDGLEKETYSLKHELVSTQMKLEAVLKDLEERQMELDRLNRKSAHMEGELKEVREQLSACEARLNAGNAQASGTGEVRAEAMAAVVDMEGPASEEGKPSHQVLVAKAGISGGNSVNIVEDVTVIPALDIDGSPEGAGTDAPDDSGAGTDDPKAGPDDSGAGTDGEAGNAGAKHNGRGPGADNGAADVPESGRIGSAGHTDAMKDAEIPGAAGTGAVAVAMAEVAAAGPDGISEEELARKALQAAKKASRRRGGRR